nr:hypothetical protein [uncultured Comamonas sp.]
MTQAQQPEALRLAAICETKGMFPVADELNRMHARILELEQGKCLHQIAEPATAGTAVRAFRDYLGVHDGIKLGGQAMDDMALDLARIALDFKHLVEPQHPDDAAVDALAVLMKAKLAKQRAKGYGGWNDKIQSTQQRLSTFLRTHVDKGDPVDVANFCAMLSARGEGITAQATPLPLLLRDIARDIGITVPQACIALKPLGNYSTNSAVTAEMAKLLRDNFPTSAHPAEVVPALASEWDGKLPERLQRALNALRLECPPAVADGVEFEVRSHYEAMHTSLSTSRRMYGAARDRLEAIDAAQPDPFAATQPAAQGLEADGMYYLQDARHHAMVGNCPSFWREGGGYTTNLDEAERFTLEAAMKQHKCRETDLPWLCSEVDKLRRPTVDCQYMPRSWDAQRAALAAQAKQGGA